MAEADKASLENVHPGLLYTLSRFIVFAACAVVLFVIGFRSWFLVLGSLVLSAPLSFFLLRKQRDAFSKRVEGRMSKRQAEKARLRAALAGDDERA